MQLIEAKELVVTKEGFFLYGENIEEFKICVKIKRLYKSLKWVYLLDSLLFINLFFKLLKKYFFKKN